MSKVTTTARAPAVTPDRATIQPTVAGVPAGPEAGAGVRPAMDEHAAAAVLADLRGPYRVPCAWVTAGSGGDQVIAFTADPVLAVLVADQLARTDLGDSYPRVAGGGVAVDRVDVVLCGPPVTDPLDWRTWQPGDDYALQACLVRPAVAGIASEAIS